VLIALHLSCKSQHENYVCPPCDMACDELTFAADGTCPHCNMNLIQYADEGAITDLKLTKGSGNFYVAGGKGNEENVIRVFYHLPKVVDSTTKVVVVLPGAGRNGDQYRDAWVGAAEAYNVLVLSLSYSEQYYPQFWNYNLAGMLTNVTLNNHGER